MKFNFHQRNHSRDGDHSLAMTIDHSRDGNHGLAMMIDYGRDEDHGLAITPSIPKHTKDYSHDGGHNHITAVKVSAAPDFLFASSNNDNGCDGGHGLAVIRITVVTMVMTYP